VNNELIIDSGIADVNIALLEDKYLVEIHTEKKDNNFSVGDLYLGRVKKVIPGLNAAFVDIGYEKDAFLHYLDLGLNISSLNKYSKSIINGEPVDPLLASFKVEPVIEKSGKIAQILVNKQLILVQVTKEPISTKGPRISSDISLAGRYIVLVPFSNEVSISQKIKTGEERTRLKRLMQSIKPKNFGVIIRTVAEGKSVADLDGDLQDLLAKWKDCYEQIKTAQAPQKVLGELNRTSTILRDLLNANFNHIHVNDPILFEEIKTYVHTIAPEKEDIVKLYKGKAPIYENFGVDKQIKAQFGRTVNLPGGAYLIVEHTEALHVIDVNSGHRMNAQNNQETNALQVNIDAAKEIARQLRLRDMGGIIVVDFIDLHSTSNRKQLYDCMKEEMKRDRAKHNILPPSKFGLVQITRQRVRPETNIVTVEKCPACDGTGEIKASILFIDEMENNIRYFVQDQNEKKLTLIVHPFIEAYLTKGLFTSVRKKWQKQYGVSLKVKASNAYHFLEYHFFNANEEAIKI
jgi:ribonuclease G